MFEIPRLVADDLRRNPACRHPVAKDGNEGIGPRLLGSGIGEEHHIEGFAPLDKLDDHGGGIDAGTPGGNDGGPCHDTMIRRSGSAMRSASTSIVSA